MLDEGEVQVWIPHWETGKYRTEFHTICRKFERVNSEVIDIRHNR